MSRPRKLTRAELEKRNEELSRENTLYMCAMNDLARHATIQIHKFRDHKDKTSYYYSLSRPDSPCGGIFYIRFCAQGQNDSTSVHYLDDIDSHNQGAPDTAELMTAIWRAKEYRRGFCEQAQKQRVQSASESAGEALQS